MHLPDFSVPTAGVPPLDAVSAAERARRTRVVPLFPQFSILLLVLAVSGCGGGGTTSANAPAAVSPPPRLSAVAQLGEKIFADQSLSASGRLSCASCHNPANAHAQSNTLSAQLGGIDEHTAGARATPSLRYLNLTPAFFFSKTGTPTGGFDRDGRAADLAQQAHRPFLAGHEMANANAAEVILRLGRTSYSADFRTTFGNAILDNPEQAFDRIGFALQQYQKEAVEFFPFAARYDDFQAGKIALTNSELRGLALFNDRSKGNCAACHPSAKRADGGPPLFTDFTYDNIGVPRNPALPANADPQFYDLGLCGPDRTDLSARSELCGKFKVPSLRNVATRKVFFHNGRFTSLREVLGFYVRRDTNPEEWYPRNPDGSINKFDDLPEQYRQNVNRTEVPYNRTPGMAPALSAQEIEDVIAFLGTLTDADQIKN